MKTPSPWLVRIALLLLLLALAAGAALAQAPPPPPVWHSPTLAWAGLTGFATDGVEPGVARTGVLFTFKVKYKHPDGISPLAVKVGIRNGNGVPIPGSPFTMTSSGSTSWVTGVVYSFSVKLIQRGVFSYMFTADDGLKKVTLPATGFKSGPVVDAVPVLSFVGSPSYTTDGVYPDSALPGTRFVFRIRYSQANGAAPTSLVLRLWNPNGTEHPKSPLTMNAAVTKPYYAKGVNYNCSLVLNTIGVYSYQFTVSDGLRTTVFPVKRLAGPTVSAG